MPGIFGCVTRDKTSAPDGLAGQMANSLMHEEWYTLDWFSGSCLLGVVGLEFLPEKSRRIVYDREKSLVGAFRGKIYNKEELTEKFGFPSDLDDGQFVIRLYNDKGLQFPKYLNGLFAVAIYDMEEDRVLIANDRYGVNPLFYNLNHKRFLFASEIKAILKDPETPVKLNREAVPEFFTLHGLLGAKTFFQNIRKMQPANVLIYDRNKDQIFFENYWDFPQNREKFDKKTSLENCFNEFGKLMKRAINRRVRDRNEIGIFLSGGLDSRILTAFATQTNKEITTFTFGIKNCVQQKIAKEVADRLGVENIFYEIPSDFITKNAEEIVCKSEGAIRIRDCHFIALLEKVQRKSKTVLLGTFGELFGLSKAKEYSKAKTKKDVISLLFKNWTKRTFGFGEHQKAFSQDFYEEIKGKMQHNLLKILKEINFDSGLDFVSYVLYRFIEPSYFFYDIVTPIDWYLESRHPFLDNDLVDFFALRFPLHLNSHKRFLQKAMNYFFPSLSDIPLEKGYPPDSRLAIELFGRAKIYSKNLIKRTLERLSNGRLTVPTDYRAYDYWLRTGSRTYVLDVLLDPKTLKRGFFKEDYIKRKLREHMTGKKNNDQLICDLINFELMNRMFFSKPSSHRKI